MVLIINSNTIGKLMTVLIIIWLLLKVENRLGIIVAVYKLWSLDIFDIEVLF